MLNVIGELSLIIFLIVLNGYFSMSEIALLSVKKSRLSYLAKSGNKKAQHALFLTRKSAEMLSTIQIGITIIGIFAGAFGGVTVAEHLSNVLAKIPLLSTVSGPMSVAIVILAITFFSLVVGELVPKQIALSHPEKLSLLVAKPIRALMTMANPLVHLLSASTMAVLRVLRIKPATEQVVTEEEIKLLIAEGTESGVFERSEQKMVGSIFHLGNRPIKDFMTPRQEVVWLDINDSLSTIRAKVAKSDRSVFPVCDGSIDNNVGVVETKDILTYLFDNGIAGIDLQSLVQSVMRIDAEVPSLVAIERLKRSAISIVLITEKTSHKIVGIISFHDILEAIVGEFKGI